MQLFIPLTEYEKINDCIRSVIQEKKVKDFFPEKYNI